MILPIKGKFELTKATQKAKQPEVYPDVSVGSTKFMNTSAALLWGAR